MSVAFAAAPAATPPPKGKIAQLTRLGRFLLPYRWRVVVSLVALLVAASCLLALGHGLRYVIDAGFGKRDPHLLNLAFATAQLRRALSSRALRPGEPDIHTVDCYEVLATTSST